MADNENKQGIILVHRSGFDFFDLAQKKVFPFNFPPLTVSDMEIINKKELETQISLFCNFYKIKPCPLIIILAHDIHFDKEVLENQEAALETTVKNFLNYLPFEESVHKIYKEAKGFYIAAVNKDLTDTFRFIFRKMNFNLEAIVPAAVVGINVKTIDGPTADFILAKLNQIKNQSIVAAEHKIRPQQTEPTRVMGVNRVFILLGVFLVLLLLMLLVLYQQTITNQPQKISQIYLTSNIDFSSLRI